ncbi:hypothetical protein DITRI_Ditri10aG0061300 [Diplodiscus trichospermus]
MSHSSSESQNSSTTSSGVSAELKLYQAFIFSVPIFFAFILLFMFYLFYLRRRRADWSSLRMRTSPGPHSDLSMAELGLKKEVREMLPIIIYKETFSIRDTQCSVCLGEYQSEDKLQQIPACGHTFHMDCIDHWLANHTTCPLCRLSVLASPKALEKVPAIQAENGQESSHAVVSNGLAVQAVSQSCEETQGVQPSEPTVGVARISQHNSDLQECLNQGREIRNTRNETRDNGRSGGVSGCMQLLRSKGSWKKGCALASNAVFKDIEIDKKGDVVKSEENMKLYSQQEKQVVMGRREICCTRGLRLEIEIIKQVNSKQAIMIQRNRIMGMGMGMGMGSNMFPSRPTINSSPLTSINIKFLSSLLSCINNNICSTHSPNANAPSICTERGIEKVVLSFGVQYTMKKPNWHIIFLCLLTVSFCIFSSSSSSSISLTGRKLAVKLMSLPHLNNRYRKPKVVEEAGFGWQSSQKASSMAMQQQQQQQYSINDERIDEDDDDEVVHNYHIDYHGVTTHPTPTPKHPLPIP